MRYTPKDEQALMAAMWRPDIADNPFKFVMFAFPWGKKGTPLEHKKGPRKWQAEYLKEMAAHIAEQKTRVAAGLVPEVFKAATASGRGPGKSTLVAWITLWMLSCHIGSTTIITANTEPQLKTKTFAEIGKWLTMAINAHWFESSVLSVFPAAWFRALVEKQLKIDCRYYSAQGQLWSEENPDAFAGAHNPLGMSVIMDEASGIPSSIFKVATGFFTEPVTYRFWNVFSNPRRGSGAFYECFHTFDENGAPYWRLRNIDAREVEDLDKALYEQQIAEHGIDSYTVRVEVLGLFPREGDNQFISSDAVRAAQDREIVVDAGAPLIMGMDVARFGDDWNTVRFRQGNDARSIPPIRWQGMDLYATADRAANIIDEYGPDAVCIDAGMGSGVIDILRRRKYLVHEVHFGASADEHQWANKGTEMYAKIRQWLPGAALDKCKRLFTDLTGRDYSMHGKSKDQIILVPKEVFKSEHGHSPDDGDALALTFAVKASRRDSRTSRYANRGAVAAGLDYELCT